MIAQSANQADIIGLPAQGAGLYRQATAWKVNTLKGASFSAHVV